jgi:hypothetical protein
MAGPPNGVPLANLSFALSAACLVMWAIMLTGKGLSRIVARNRLIAECDRPAFASLNEITDRPDPWLEYLLRGAFAEFDRELRKIMPRLYGQQDEN